MRLTKEQLLEAIEQDSWHQVVFVSGKPVSQISEDEWDDCPVCSFCRKQPASVIMADGFLTCSKCLPDLSEYYNCEICHTALPASLASWARKRLERVTCSADCSKKREVKYGRLCCDKAEVVPCTCARSYRCSDHAPNGFHVGTH